VKDYTFRIAKKNKETKIREYFCSRLDFRMQVMSMA
jgi:hypothetical protein